MKNKNTRTPETWQMDAAELTSGDTVQFWAAGTMFNARMPTKQARVLVQAREAFVINKDAIGLLTDGQMDA